MTDARLHLLTAISRARPSHDPALFDSGARSAYERGFEQMRAIALAAVRKKAAVDAGED